MSTKTSETTAGSVSEELVDEMNRLLSDYSVLYQKLRAYHWNVEGQNFFLLHEKFEELYDRTKLVVDEIAERIRAYGEYPVSTYSEQLVEARISEDNGQIGANAMVENLCSDYENLQEALNSAKETAEKDGDTTTVNLLDDIQDEQEETLWMFKSFLA